MTLKYSAVLLAAQLSALAAMYTAFPTDNLPWRVEDLNDRGEMVGSGSSYALYHDGLGIRHADVFGAGPGRSRWGIYYRINNHGTLVGQSTTPYHNGYAPLRGFIRNLDTSIIPLTAMNSLGGPGGESAVLGVNDQNELVGQSDSPTGLLAVRFALDGTPNPLSIPSGPSMATGINNAGDII